MLQNAKIPMTSRSWGFRWSLGVGIRVGQRRYLSEKAKSRLRGSKVCLIAIAPAWLVRVLAEGVLAFLLDHCQVGFAVMSIIGISFFCVCKEKARKHVHGLVWLGAAIKIIYM